MNASIFITGVSGSGKSAVCDELNKLGYKAYGIENIKGLFTMVNKKTGKIADDYDIDIFKLVKQHDWICDKNKLKLLLQNNSNGVVFYCGTATNQEDLFPLFDKIFLLKVSKKILRERLINRSSNHFARTPEVQKWIFRWKGRWENHLFKKGAQIINANFDLNKVVADIIDRSKSIYPE